MAVLAEKAFIGLAEEEAALMGDVPGITRPMTYEEYMDSPEEMARYDILDGWKVYRLYEELQTPNPSKQHQRIQRRIARPFEDYEDNTGSGSSLAAPCDVAISLRPLRCRQSDVLFISRERASRNESMTDSTPLAPAPELVVEILSPSDSPSVLAAKLADYASVDVQEVWLARPAARTIEVRRLLEGEFTPVATYGSSETVALLTFPDLTVAVDDIFAE